MRHDGQVILQFLPPMKLFFSTVSRRADQRALFPIFLAITIKGAIQTYALSDHLSFWIQINTDTLDEQLDQIINL